jgi:phenylalanyl-tRNA synthetase beta chain
LVELKRKDLVLGTFGAVAPEALKTFDITQPVFQAELVDAAWSASLRERKVEYTEVPRFPSVRRDLSLLLDQAVTYADLEKLAFRAERELLRAVDLFDVYEGDKLPKGKKSYALSFILQDGARTLTDDVVEKAMGRIRQAFEREVGAELRA